MNLGILVSHEGTTLQSIIDACASGRIAGRIVVVISNNSTSGALARARQSGIRGEHMSSTTHDSPEALDMAIRNALLDAGVDLVFLAGYMKQVGPSVLAAFKGRILNTHPALCQNLEGRACTAIASSWQYSRQRRRSLACPFTWLIPVTTRDQSFDSARLPSFQMIHSNH
jgi:folate-dependent phosphoribosylglycinamide formyltransferase PurN